MVTSVRYINFVIDHRRQKLIDNRKKKIAAPNAHVPTFLKRFFGIPI